MYKYLQNEYSQVSGERILQNRSGNNFYERVRHLHIVLEDGLQGVLLYCLAKGQENNPDSQA